MKKILCTIGPASLNEHTIRQFEKNQVDVLRINLSHTAVEDIVPTIKKIRSLTELPICLDTEGAQVRIGQFAEAPQSFEMNQMINLHRSLETCDAQNIFFTPAIAYDQLNVGDLITIDFNSVMAQVTEVTETKKVLKILQGGQVGNNKAVTIEKDVSLPPFSDKDLEAFRILKEYHIKHVAFSFAHSGDDVRQLRKIVGSDVSIISKIECLSGLKNLEDICRESNAILIDRGDLSRQVPIEKIPAAQKQIIHTAKRCKCDVVVATNLLESMILSSQPTRAEVNDIYNTLLDGADGLVLAAETAIGKYPAQCVSMVRKVIKVFEMSDRQALDLNSISDTSLSILPPPHGGLLNISVNHFPDSKVIATLKKIPLDERQILDCEQIALGTFSPLKGFMNRDELQSTIERNKLPCDTSWTMPVILQITDEQFNRLSVGEVVALTNQRHEIHSTLEIEQIYQINLSDIARGWFTTDSKEHPGVKRLYELGDKIIAGKVTLIKKDAHFYRKHELAPAESRKVFNLKGWSKIVAFHTRNIPHKAHYWAQLKALQDTKADGLYITPLVGPKKPGDFLDIPILESYTQAIKAGHYPKDKVLLGQFSTYPRYAGPREALFTAICRKNMGCSHFIIGRDHSGVMDFYKNINLEKYVESIGDLGIELLFYPEFAYSSEKDTYLEYNAHEKLLRLSGSDIRDKLQSKNEIPAWMILPEVANYLKTIPSGELFHS